jgi:undecaprenyl-diphosphatase
LEILKAIILGVIQGLTEFLPISSTAHLTLAGKLMGMIDPLNTEHWTATIAVIQLGTLIAVFAYFIKDVYNIIIEFFSDLYKRITGRSPEQMSGNAKMGWLIIIGTVPVGIAGLLFRKVIEGTLTKNLYVIAGSMITLAVLLWIAEIIGKRKREINQITIWDSLFIGFAESLAVIPGSSRSGTTITGGLFLGLTRESAAKFSFLLSLPAVLSSGFLELKESLKEIPHTSAGTMQLIIATVVSGIVGYISIWFLLNYLKKHSTGIFIVYRIVIGIIILILLSTNVITN